MQKTFQVSTDKRASKGVKCVYANARSTVSKEKRAEIELIAREENPALTGFRDMG